MTFLVKAYVLWKRGLVWDDQVQGCRVERLRMGTSGRRCKRKMDWIQATGHYNAAGVLCSWTDQSRPSVIVGRKKDDSMNEENRVKDERGKKDPPVGKSASTSPVLRHPLLTPRTNSRREQENKRKKGDSDPRSDQVIYVTIRSIAFSPHPDHV